MDRWTDSAHRQGRDDPRPVRVNWWALLGLLALVLSGVVSMSLIALALA